MICQQGIDGRLGKCPKCFFFFFTLVTGPRRSLSLKLSDTRVYEPQIRALQVICEQGIDGRLGKCPKCSSWVTIGEAGVISGGVIAGTCTM